MTWLVKAEPGTRVVLCGDHPWREHCGVVVRWERPFFAFAPLPVVLLDNGQECYVMDAEQWREAP